MQAERIVSHLFCEGLVDGIVAHSSGVNHIEHTVSKMDTLAGVAVKYGVEVADIKRLNGLVTDHQMFAHKSLQIPLPGSHPPSPRTSRNGEQSPVHSELTDGTTVAEAGDKSEAERCSTGEPVRRHQMANTDPILCTSELVDGGGGFSAGTGQL